MQIVDECCQILHSELGILRGGGYVIMKRVSCINKLVTCSKYSLIGALVINTELSYGVKSQTQLSITSK